MQLYVSVKKPYQDYTIDINELRKEADRKAKYITSILFTNTVNYNLTNTSHFVVPVMDMQPLYVHKYSVVPNEEQSNNYILYVVYDINAKNNLNYLGLEGSLGAVQISEPIEENQLIFKGLEKAERENNYKLKFVFTYDIVQ